MLQEQYKKHIVSINRKKKCEAATAVFTQYTSNRDFPPDCKRELYLRVAFKLDYTAR